MALMTVYHGSGDVVAAPEIRVGRYTKDFGPGFYCTVIREQAERWAQRMPVPRVNTYVVRFAQGLDILEFPEMSEEWLDFIVACRPRRVPFPRRGHRRHGGRPDIQLRFRVHRGCHHARAVLGFSEVQVSNAPDRLLHRQGT